MFRLDGGSTAWRENRQLTTPGSFVPARSYSIRRHFSPFCLPRHSRHPSYAFLPLSRPHVFFILVLLLRREMWNWHRARQCRARLAANWPLINALRILMKMSSVRRCVAIMKSAIGHVKWPELRGRSKVDARVAPCYLVNERRWAITSRGLQLQTSDES